MFRTHFIEMNNISKKLYSAIARPVMADIQSSYGSYPSDASVPIVEADGTVRVVGACHRQIFYRSTTPTPVEERNPDWIISSILGNKIHDMMGNLIDEFGIRMGLQRIRSEHRFFDPLTGVSGRSDLVLWDVEANEPIGVELKSVGEWKASQVMLKPAEEHVLQSMVYLDYYRNNIPKGQPRPTRWYILYIARSESWALKSKNHGSPFTNIWDFYITLNDKDQAVIHSHNGVETWEQFNIETIHKRFQKIQQEVKAKVKPNRDYILKYSEEMLVALHKRGKLLKKDSTVVEKWLKDGAVEGTLNLELGDFECKMCPWREECWGLPKVSESFSPYDLAFKNMQAKVEPKKEYIEII